MSETIYFNGKKYNSVAEMPSTVRQNYEKVNRLFVDADQDGIPDIAQLDGLTELKETFSAIKDIAQLRTTQGVTAEQFSIVRVTDGGIHVNGKGYSRVEDMPDYVRKEYERIVNAAQDGRGDIFDESWREVDREEYFKPHDDEILNRQTQQTTAPVDSSIEVVDSNNRFILIAIAAFLILGSLAAVWFLLF